MEDGFENLTPEERLKAENDLLRLRLSAETGVDFFKNDKHDLDPYIENQWLNNIREFEKLFPNAKQTTVYEFIGKPDFKPASQLKEKQMEKELARLLELMSNRGVNISFLCEYDLYTKYAFITEELFQQEIDDVRIDGMMNNFIYEEFHPNHEDDLERFVMEFLESLFDREWDQYDGHQLSKEMMSCSGRTISCKEVIERIKLFQETWKKFRIMKQEIVSISFDLEAEKASVILFLEYHAGEKKTDMSFISGQAFFDFEYKHDFWYLTKINIPGFRI
jgi:hypothetical protein